MLTYSSYLKVDELTSLQHPVSEGPEHDEMLFIIVHQVYELWFKQLLHELDFLQELLPRKKTAQAQHTFRRLLTILKVLVSQIDVLETMTPLEFLSFRDRLESGSGFQSYQFRELEMALGLKDRSSLARYAPDSAARQRLEARYKKSSLWDAFLHYLVANGYDLPPSQLQRDVTQSVEPSPDVQRILIHLYRNDAAASQICERMVDLDEGLQEWRYRHVKMVQRTIGSKRGTGGSAGAEYLKTTLLKPLFPDLWAIRSEL